MARTIGGIELGLAGVLLLVGIVLFLFPEPVTSGLGVTLILLGILIWAAGELT